MASEYAHLQGLVDAMLDDEVDVFKTKWLTEMRNFDALATVYHFMEQQYAALIAQGVVEAPAGIAAVGDGIALDVPAAVEDGLALDGVELHAPVDNSVPVDAPTAIDLNVAAHVMNVDNADPIDEDFHSAQEEFPQVFYPALSSPPRTTGKAARRYKKRLMKKKKQAS